MSDASASARAVRLAIAAVAAVGAIFIASAAFLADGHLTFALFDDAMISMRYASNLAGGYGLVWNPGEPPVEGYTNLLWTLGMAVLHLLPVPARLTSLLVSLLGLAIILATAAACGRLAARMSPPHRAAAANVTTILLVGLCFPMMFWTLRGLEVGLMTLLAALAIEQVMRLAADDRHGVALLSVLLALMVWTRPDGLLPALTIAAAAGLAAPSRNLRVLTILSLVPIAALGVHTLWRHSYYGDWLPNTYYLKMEGVTLRERVGRGLEVGITTSKRFLLFPALAVLLSPRLFLKPENAACVAVPAILLAYSVYVGGDAWEFAPFANRYITPGLVLLLPAGVASVLVAVASPGARLRVAVVLGLSAAILFLPLIRGNETVLIVAQAIAALACVAAAARLYHGSTGLATASLVAVLFIGSSLPGYVEWIRRGNLQAADDEFMTRLGLLVRASTTSEARIAVTWAGAMPYFSQRPALDLLGKSDRTIAHMAPAAPFFPGHNKFDYEYSIVRQRPDVILHFFRHDIATREQLVSIGYRDLSDKVFVRSDSRSVDADRLALGLAALGGQ